MTRDLASVVRGGASLDDARAVAILVHGRGASAEGMMALGAELGTTDVAYIAPQAPNQSWYPYSFLAPIAQNEPYLTNALGTLDGVIKDLEARGASSERIFMIGFSQGACLALEYVARNARRYGGVAGLSGGLIGPDITPQNYPGSLANTPVFLGCSDVDRHIPLARVHQTADVLRRLGGHVTKQIYPGMPHTIVEDEVQHVRRMLAGIPPAIDKVA